MNPETSFDTRYTIDIHAQRTGQEYQASAEAFVMSLRTLAPASAAAADIATAKLRDADIAPWLCAFFSAEAVTDSKLKQHNAEIGAAFMVRYAFDEPNEAQLTAEHARAVLERAGAIAQAERERQPDEDPNSY